MHDVNMFDFFILTIIGQCRTSKRILIEYYDSLRTI